jgi:hypothetical protein
VGRAVTVRFLLRRAGKVTFLIQGPLPSCNAVRRLKVAGKPGMNRLQLTWRSGGKALRQGLYRVSALGQTAPKVIVGIRIRKGRRIAPVPTHMLPAGWCVPRYSFLPGVLTGDVYTTVSSHGPSAPPPSAKAPVVGGVEAARADVRPLRIGPAKLALQAVRATAGSDGTFLKWIAVAIVGLVALSVPFVLLVAAWRDLVRHA